jgi:ferredoxin
MKVSVDQDLCIACGTCIDLAPAVFDWDDEGLAHVIVEEVPEDAEDLVREAIESCPTDAIKET